jgi:Poly-beta-hydroxybutyrate polymerase N terminal
MTTETFEPPPPTSQTFEVMDRALHAAVGRLTRGISPIMLARAYVDWLVHLGLSPGKQAQLVTKRRARRCVSPFTRHGRPATPQLRHASSHCRRTIASTIQLGCRGASQMGRHARLT